MVTNTTTGIVELLEKVTNPGCFSISGMMDTVPPGLSVKNIGAISLPLCSHQAEEIKKISIQAPFGRGEDTVVDTKVRNVWQLSVNKFNTTNPAWDDALTKSVKKISNELGLHGCKIGFSPYKLLLYEKGSFFTAHRDTEKVDKMFATLVINLPSHHAGGELIVNHGGKQKIYSFNDMEFNPAFVAFYADCYHEIKPVTKGYRLCLIYNLFITNRVFIPTLSSQAKYISDIDTKLKVFFENTKNIPIFTYLLEHHYSEKNLSLTTLKNGDFAKATALLNIAKEKGYTAFLCLVSYHFSSYGESIHYGQRGYRSDELEENEYEEYDVIKEATYAHNFINIDGEHIENSTLNFDENYQIHAKTNLLDGPGKKLYISEATGNEGATKDLWYHRGGVVIWKKEKEFIVANQMNSDYKINFLKRYIAGEAANKNHKELLVLAENIISEKGTHDECDISLELIELGNAELIKKYFLKKFESYSLNNVNGEALLKALDKFELAILEKDIIDRLKSHQRIAAWILSLLLNTQNLTNNNKKTILWWIVSLRDKIFYGAIAEGKIEYIIQIASLLQDEVLVESAINFFTNEMVNNSLFTIEKYGPAIIRVLVCLDDKTYNKKIINQFIQHSLKYLLDIFSSSPEKPKTFYRDGCLKCDCNLCKQVNEFLPKEDESKLIIPQTLKRNVLHIESELKLHDIDADIKLVRDPPKFTGILTKNMSGYDNKIKHYREAQKIIVTLKNSSM